MPGDVALMNSEMGLKIGAKLHEVSRQTAQAVGVIFYLGESNSPRSDLWLCGLMPALQASFGIMLSNIYNAVNNNIYFNKVELGRPVHASG